MLWEMLHDTRLHQNKEDQIKWKFTTFEEYTTLIKQFLGNVKAPKVQTISHGWWLKTECGLRIGCSNKDGCTTPPALCAEVLWRLHFTSWQSAAIHEECGALLRLGWRNPLYAHNSGDQVKTLCNDGPTSHYASMYHRKRFVPFLW